MSAREAVTLAESGETLENAEPPLIAIVGPTAVGKTAIGIALAEKIGGEIISADAVAVYTGLDIGTAKPDVAERTRIPFHLVDVVSPNEDFTVADYVRLAEVAIEDIRQRGKRPILVGGTGLYIRAMTATLSVPNVPPQIALRAALWEEVRQYGPTPLHQRLADVDAESASKILSGDAKRIIRALEVYSVTGKPLSSFHTPEGVQGIPRPNTAQFGLTMDRERLYARIEARVDAMMVAGFLDEVQELVAAGYGSRLKAMQSLGYRHLVACIAGETTLKSAIEELKRDTRRFAKRQLSWFNADPNITWLDVERNAIVTEVREASPPEREMKFTAPTAEAVAETIADALASR